ncbi:metalloregulator ArsR/SmtB family transcription factor [Nesterenkonia sp. LB17]|uniref:ArsR/SmtB family transcription factor n=1 Tax=unclassified Nesterenkonia TaxID=2629769 RepID=UPI001F4C775F|nr:metalloregulator ArsR/SmtB family transcription factor [Nesterenkonia sp. DZ6]MCH8565674.1 metalloregulator ArsR/SmtB family transcription factor [Nesterenkonia sp. LB17]
MPTTLPAIRPDELAACCVPVTGGLVNDETAETLARVFKALGDPTRVKLLSMIAAAPEGEACICEMTGPIGLGQPTVSHHMRILVDAGLTRGERRGKWIHYRVAPDALQLLAGALAPAGDPVACRSDLPDGTE